MIYKLQIMCEMHCISRHHILIHDSRPVIRHCLAVAVLPNSYSTVSVVNGVSSRYYYIHFVRKVFLQYCSALLIRNSNHLMEKWKRHFVCLKFPSRFYGNTLSSEENSKATDMVSGKKPALCYQSCRILCPQRPTLYFKRET